MQLRAHEPLNDRYMCNGSSSTFPCHHSAPSDLLRAQEAVRWKDSIDAIIFAAVWGRKHGRIDPVDVEFS
ncbi:hypothetical protein N7528_001524 [Penicillium herquei]|nr:hypothetical protein N7528_001524 [Penicillium herquei]